MTLKKNLYKKKINRLLLLDELQKRNEVIRAISKRLKMAEVREQDSRKELSSIQQQMQELSQRHQHSSQHHQDLEVTALCISLFSYEHLYSLVTSSMTAGRN